MLLRFLECVYVYVHFVCVYAVCAHMCVQVWMLVMKTEEDSGCSLSLSTPSR